MGGAAAFARQYARRHPVAVSVALVSAIAAIACGSLWGADVSGAGTGPDAVFGAGRWWTPVTALLVPDSPLGAIMAIVLALTVLAYAESLLGRLRLLWVMAVVGLAAIAAAFALSTVVDALVPDDSRQLAETPVSGPSIAIIGAVMTATAFASALWRRRLRLIGFAVLSLFALYTGQSGDWYRLAAAAVGLVLGLVLARNSLAHPWRRSSVRETRALVAVVVAVIGFGPFAAILAGGGRGPLSLVVSAFTEYNQKLVARCETEYMRGCDHQWVLVVTRGLGPTLLALVPLVLLLVAALGLRQGRRAGLVLAVTVLTLLAAVSVVSLLTGDLYIEPWANGTGLEYLLWGVASIGIPLAAAVAVVLLHRRFPIRATLRATVAFAIVTGLAFLVCANGFLALEWGMRRAFDVEPSTADLIAESVRRFIPPAFLQGDGAPPVPRHGPALLIYQWIGVSFWTIFIAATLALYRRVRVPVASDAALYRALLRRGGGTLGYLGTWSGNSYWYSDDRQSAIAFRLVGDVAIALGDPLATPADGADAVRGFIDYCGVHNWTPVFYSVHDAALPVFDELGWEHVSVGEETVMLVADVTLLAGREWRKVRQPLTRAEREGVTAVWTRWQELTPAQIAQITEIDEVWVADKALPEMGFTLGGLEEAKDPEVRLLLAVDADGRIQVVTSWLPSWRDGHPAGLTLDFMRRRPDGPNGLMEFVIAKAALHARDAGLTELSLSGAPLAVKPGEEDVAGEPTILSAVLGWVRAALEPAYGFASLFRFKSKFHPEYRTIHLAYGDPVALPRIGIAVGRAYLPEASPRDVLALARMARGSRR